MIEIAGMVSMVLAVAGVILNNRRMIVCFYFWMISNMLSAWIHLDAGVYSLLARDVIFFILAIEGLIKWQKEK